MILKRAFVWWFPLYLLAVQHAGFAHLMSHALNAVTDQEQLAPSDCAKCTSFAKVSTATGSALCHPASPSNAVVGIAELEAHVTGISTLAPRSRSPPEVP
jgi:hypothetical protein